jgi:glycosyltransferase involved in cell wall biosynthesis
MVVAVDTLFMSERFRRTGTGVYLRHLLSEWIKVVEREFPEIELHGFTSARARWRRNGFNNALLHVHQTRALDSKALWLLGGMALQSAKVGADLVFLPTAQHSFPGWSAPVVATILDAIPKRLPSSMNPSSAWLHAKTWINARLARRIITISSWSKRDLVEIYGVKPERVHVTYLGYDSDLFNSSEADPESSADLLRRLGVHEPYVLHHGMVQLRKNVHRLIQAWELVHATCPDLDTQLVLAGPMGHGHEEILRVRNAAPHRKKIILTGELADAELALLIKNAALCVIPSLYEGFCLPMVEAMACGVPTIVSSSSCLPEISGNVLEYFDPASIEEMAGTIRRALEDSCLRDRLRVKGLSRAADFSWQRCARETMQILIETFNDSGRKRAQRVA